MGFPGGSAGKESAHTAGDLGSVPGLGRSPGGGHGNLLQYSCLENPMDRGAWQATVHGVAESQTRLKRLCTRSAVGTGPPPMVGPGSVAPASTDTRLSQLPSNLGLGEAHPVKHMMVCHGALFNFLKMSDRPMYPDREHPPCTKVQ